MKKIFLVFFIAFIALCLLFLFEIFIPQGFSLNSDTYTIRKGMGVKQIANELKDQGVIKNNLFFRMYVIGLLEHTKLQAGTYEVSSSMSIAQIVKKFVSGDVVKNQITLIDGWTLKDMAEYLESKNLSLKKDFLEAAKEDWSKKYSFLGDKPKAMDLEGYLFPDTYEIYGDESSQEIIDTMLSNFDKKLTSDIRKEISLQHKSIFQIITMASIIEKEVRSLEDKKIVSGILWKRITAGMPLQADSTVNYVTHKSDASVTLVDTKINSPYNTYKYAGLPLGPISNPGIDSIMAALYPEKSPYWYYLSTKDTGESIFSKTLEEHNVAKVKYLF